VKDEKSDEVVVVFDCGATNLRVVAIDPYGRIAAQTSFPNSPKPQSGSNPEWLVWDLDEIWLKLCKAAIEVTKKVGPRNIKAVTVITWGADGAPVSRDGGLLYPVISWQCPRTTEVVKNISDEMSPFEIFRITGYQLTPFNTLIKLIWLRENAPDVLDNAHTWLMMAGLLSHKLTGLFHIDPTSASTTMAMDLGHRDWSTTMLDLAGLNPNFFPEWLEPGQIVGYVTKKAEESCGIPSGVPVVVGGHDTQFALFGSLPGLDDVVLSSGTWEILSYRSNRFNPSKSAFNDGVIIEADVNSGLWNPQLLMMGSGALEWVTDMLFPETGENKYDVIVREADSVPAGSGGVFFVPRFVKETGPARKYGTEGAILGLTLHTTKGQIVRAAFEGLSFQLAQALQILEREKGSRTKEIRAVGGGSKNRLWNQIRADVTGFPVIVTDLKECASLGAALVSFLGLGRYGSPEEARESIQIKEETFRPSRNREIYGAVLKVYAAAVRNLGSLKSVT
jgi:L-fuculokinase